MRLHSRLLSACTYGFVSFIVYGMSTSEAFADEKSAADGSGNVVIGPDYKIDPDLTDKGNPKGKTFQFSMRLADSKIFPGDDTTLDPKKEVR
jgi:hypothetical protein